MRAVYKYTMGPLSKPLFISCTEEAKVVLVALQHGLPNIWVDDDRHPHRVRTNWVFIVVGTGYPIPDGSEHVGSYQQGEFVWHAYRLPVTVQS